MKSTENEKTRGCVLEKLRALKEKRGFTLVEAIIVIAIIAVMTAMIVPNVMNQGKATQDSYSAVAMSLYYYGQDSLNLVKHMTVGRTLGDGGKWRDVYAWKTDVSISSSTMKNYQKNGVVDTGILKDPTDNNYRKLGTHNAIYFKAGRSTGGHAKIDAIQFIFGDGTSGYGAANVLSSKSTSFDTSKSWTYNGTVDVGTGISTFPVDAKDSAEQVYMGKILERVANNLNATLSLLDDESTGTFVLIFDERLRVTATYHSKFDIGEWSGTTFNNHALGNVIVGAYPRYLCDNGVAFADTSKTMP